MIIIGASEVDIADLHVFTAEEAEGNQMDFIRAARPERTGRHTVQIFAAGVLHPDYAAARYAACVQFTPGMLTSCPYTTS